MTTNNMAFTHTDVKKSQFTWKIDHFSGLSSSVATGIKLDSPAFIVKPDDNMKWRLCIWPNARDTNHRVFLSVSLTCFEYSSFDVQLKVAMYVKDINGRKCFEQIVKSCDHDVHFDKFIPKNLLDFENNGILLNDVLTLVCELTVVYKASMKKVDKSIEQNAINLSNKILNAFEQQFEKQEFSDVTLVASCGKELRAHKFVLAAHSPVFAAMFTHNVKEKTDPVEIKDLDYDSLKEMLRFMYAGKVENLDKVADGVLVAREKYQIEGLKELCEEYFFQNISIENVIETLIFSIRHNLDKIKLLAKKFIRCHAKDVSSSAAFKDIDEPDLFAEIVKILADVS